LVIGAIGVGAITQWLLLFLLRSPVRIFSGFIGKPIWNWTLEHDFDSLRGLWFGGLGGVGGPVFFTMLVVFATTGWLVARLDRSHPAALSTIYAASTPIFAATWLYRESSFAHPTWSFLLVAIPLSALLGGVWPSPWCSAHHK
jgi:hypothetical protein